MNAVFRDLFLTLAELVLNLVSIHCLRKYFKNREKLLNNQPTSRRKTITETNIQGNSSAQRQAVGSSLTNIVVSSADLRASVMTVMICSLSILEHIAFISCVVSPYFNPSFLVGNYICFGANFGIGLKHSANFFIFYLFNKKFSAKLHDMFRF
jgi:hypothetical protein